MIHDGIYIITYNKITGIIYGNSCGIFSIDFDKSKIDVDNIKIDGKLLNNKTNIYNRETIFTFY